MNLTLRKPAERKFLASETEKACKWRKSGCRNDAEDGSTTKTSLIEPETCILDIVVALELRLLGLYMVAKKRIPTRKRKGC